MYLYKEKLFKKYNFKLNKISSNYDLIVITRGGGSHDLFQFNNVKLIESV